MCWVDDLNYGLAAFGLRVPKPPPANRLMTTLAKSPAARTAAVVGASAVLFYAAERRHNPKVRDIYDALIYTSTCLSVGYGDIFARTPAGKLIGTALMTAGPALSSRALDGLAKEPGETAQEEIVATLKAILARLQDGRDSFHDTPAAERRKNVAHGASRG